ncbi:hypothetical protein B296_00052363 [Ensete ventricosum]|uniref:Uncharacterized protein n=1 Tax=Ensete ventricosum TaxID=4639 RepID=A0A426X3T2_ENSVE|nr:hypothetical protein B296_00052363 [Ensete ventricosum]
MADLTQVRPIPSPVDASLTVRMTSMVEAYDDRVTHKGNRVTSGRTADLTQVRSALPTCKRTPHCKDDKHGGGHDDMVEGTVACELPLRTEEIMGELAHMGLNQ